ncbi:zinc-dependent alcohol dehydrogenase family protein [Sandaracinobacteroides hominis]|uniref:zinc-dependent alcohol dehydrogenase family protein n=1 Tax=Sandaracinobacteroides hominis TaxID=2780086 RepID=UPI0018F38FF6|nr:NAD(P)-dependent alcohol dehydrogenase [Sandaracinobacteroides hominis]
MFAYQIGPQQGIASLNRADVTTPVPGAGEVLVKVKRVCLNHRDLLIVSGKYGPTRPENRIPCSDGVGEVAAVGEGVSDLAIGDRVSCGHFVTWLDGAFSQSIFGADLGVSRDGWLAEYVRVPAAALQKIPASISDESAAPLAAAGLTAWHAVVEFGGVKPGDIVLAPGTGGVSIFALQIAKMAGARVVVTSSSDEKLEIARKLGADITLNYRTTPDWPGALMAATGGHGADIVLEMGGQAALAQSIAAAAVNGRIAIIGALAGPAGESIPNFPSIIGKNLLLKGIAAGSQAMFGRFVAAVAANGLEPVIDRAFPFNEAKAAYAHLHSGAHIGKVMIEVG